MGSDIAKGSPCLSVMYSALVVLRFFLPWYSTPSPLTHFIEYYYQKKGVNRIDELVQSNVALLKILDGDTKAGMKTFLKENNLNIKEEAELLKAFEFLNQ